jgi:glucose-1-phosphate cytidylyltransferase
VKAIILAGGLGTRIAEETETKPKPMVLINGKPILWHIMGIYASQGINEFIIAGGYKVSAIKEWVNELKTHWQINVIDTGVSTQTGWRIKECIQHFQEKEFFVTYGDGLANVNIEELYKTHKIESKIATVTAVRPPARFGRLHIEDESVTKFGEKNQSEEGWINGGFFVVDRSIIKFIDNSQSSFEYQTLPLLVSKKQLSAFKHSGFWQPMDTLREKTDLEKFAQEEIPPWLVFGRHE